MVWFIKKNSIAVICFFLSLFLSCTETPTNPFAKDKTTAALVIHSSPTLKALGGHLFTDTLGAVTQLGIASNLMTNLDTVQIAIVSTGAGIDTDAIITNFTDIKDTVWVSYTWRDTGTKIIYTKACVHEWNTLKDTAFLTVYARPNHPPRISVSGKLSISTGILCSLSVVASDPDAGQTLFYSIGNEPSGAQFDTISKVFRWTPGIADTGTDTILFKVVDNGFPPLADSQKVAVTVSPSTNHRPVLTVSGERDIKTGTTCTLSASATDPDSNQTLTYSMINQPTGSSFNPGTHAFTWAAPAAFKGTDTAIFTVIDNGVPPKSDTVIVQITVSDSAINHPPKWKIDTVNLVTTVGATINLTLSDKCSDPDGDSLTFTLLSGTPVVDTIKNSVYSFTPAIADTGVYWPQIIASDPKGLRDTLRVRLTVPAGDRQPPYLKLFSPASDSATVGTSPTPVKIVCKDSSGVASVKCSMGTDTFPVSHSDSTYTASVTGFKTTGVNEILFIATDASVNANRDTLKVHIKYDPTIGDNVPPTLHFVNPTKDTVIGADSFVVQAVCYDPSRIFSLVGLRDSTAFTLTRSATIDSLWTGTAKGIKAGQYSTVKLIATDSSTARNKDTVSVRVKYDNDVTGPAITLVTPSKDSAATNSSSYTVTLQCTDASGVLSVNGVMGTSIFTGTRGSGSNWTVIINGLTSNAFNTIIFTATDSSLRANKTMDTLRIKYDPTMLDSIGPTIIQKSGSSSGSVITNPIITITDSIIDPSGIDSVYWTLNGIRANTMTAISGSSTNFSLRDTLTVYRINRVVIYVIDNSTRHNRDSVVMILDYNMPPIINDTAIATNRNTAKTWILNAQPVDNDSLSWSRLTSPSTLSGSITGTLPSVTFTPATNWSGNDSFYVRVSDGYWSDTAKIKITVANILVAPSIVTQPSSATKNVGQSITFSVAINADVNPDPLYQWKHNGIDIATAKSSSFTIGSIALSDSGSYAVTVSNSAGTITSQAAILTVNYAPSITTQPVSQTLYLSQPATFTVAAIGNPTPTYIWKKNGIAISGQTGASLTISMPGISDSGKYTVTVNNSVSSVVSDTARFYSVIKSIAAGGNHSLFLKTDGRLFACGGNTHGQIGDNSTTDRHSPVQIMTSVQSMSAGENHSLILKTDGTLFACGGNAFGQLGDGSTNDRLLPVQIMTGVKAISAGGSHSLILINDGTLFACGYNGNGQIGNNTFDNQLSPVQITPSVVSIAAGANFSLIIKTGGTLFAFGGNTYGQLGDGGTANQPVPEQIITGVQSVSAGSEFSLILKTDGTMLACGDNWLGQLGDGTTMNTSPVPEQIATNVQSVSAGNVFSLILKKDGTLFASGNNSAGQFGDGTTNNQSTPVQIENISNAQSMATGGSYSLILKTDGTLSACGDNTYGQLGDGTTTGHLTPFNLTFK